MGPQEILAVVGAAIAVLTLLGLLHRMLLKPVVTEIRETFGWLQKFRRDWDGEPAEPGRDRVPGVMERLNRIDGELQRNGGASLKDQVIKTREQIEALSFRVDTIEIRQCEIQKAINAK